MTLRQVVSQRSLGARYASGTEQGTSVVIMVYIHHKYPEADFIFTFIS